LKDVLGHSVDEIAELLGMTVPAVKAALHRGRGRLHEARSPRAAVREVSAELARYAASFNAHDWDAVRAMLAEDVHLDLVSRSQRAGRKAVSGYLTNYSAKPGWRVAPATLEGAEVLAVFRDGADARPGYFIELTWAGSRVVAIRDFRYVPYIAADAAIALVG
jgi:RNA polymerase sigma-70 factor (ECF subfamily)